jgi:methyltransferase
MVTLARYLGLLAVIGAQRSFELWLSARNTRRAQYHGAIEVGRAHYAPMVAMHALFLPACALAAWRRPSAPPAWLSGTAIVALLLAEGLRVWAIGTLGERWSTRVLRWPGLPPVERGPYRFVRHPNYLAVALELAAIPLVWGSWPVALAFSAANAGLMSVRIPVEERAVYR